METSYCMCMNEVSGDCHPVEVDTDIWTQVAAHGAGNQKGAVIPNRTILYRLHGPDGPFLVVLNALWGGDAERGPIASIRKLSEELGAPVRFVLTPGSMHSLNLHLYARAFPEARVCIPRGRIMRASPDLMLEPNVELYAPDAPPCELAEAGLRVHVFAGLVEGPMTVKFQKMQGALGYVPGSIEPQVFLHEPSGTITNGGHHMWYRHDDRPLMTMPFMMRRMMEWLQADLDLPVGKLSLERNGAFALADRAAAQASAKTILSWTFDRMIDIHAAPGGIVREGARALWEEALGPVARGAWDEVPWHATPPPKPRFKTLSMTLSLRGDVRTLWDAMFDYDQPLPGLDARVEALKPGIDTPLGTGSMRSIVIDGGAPLLEEMVDVVPYESFAYRILKGGPYAYYRGRATLRQDGEQVVMSYSADFLPKIPFTTPLLWIMFKLMARKFGPMWQQMIDDRRAQLGTGAQAVLPGAPAAV